MTDDERARELWELGTKRLSEGQVEEAVKLFEQSIAVKPTAEGHTFRGWALSHEGHLDEAIEDCKQAIQLDPEFGNPYNDIGVYLMQKRQFDEAIPSRVPIPLEVRKRQQRFAKGSVAGQPQRPIAPFPEVATARDKARQHQIHFRKVHNISVFPVPFSCRA